MKQNSFKFNIRGFLAGYVDNFGESKPLHESQEPSLYLSSFLQT